MKNEIDQTVERIRQRGDDHKLYCPTCKAGRNCMDHLMIRENDLQEQVTQLKADLATAKQALEVAEARLVEADEVIVNVSVEDTGKTFVPATNYRVKYRIAVDAIGKE